MKNYLVKNYIDHWGKIHGEPLYAEELSPYELIVETETGYTVLYNDQEGTIRSLPRDCDCMSEEECRREFKYNLRKLLADNCMTQGELAEVTGISETTICSYTSGRSLPGFYNIDKMARALNCSIEDFRYMFKK